MSDTTVKQIDDYYRLMGERTVKGEVQPRPLRFLMIDDDEDFQLLVKRDFARRGFIMDGALNSHEGYNKAVVSDPPYTLIVLDVQGIGEPVDQAFKRLRENVSASPVAICTGFPMDREVKACTQHGPFWLLEKPLDVGRLSAIFEHYRDMLAPQTI